MTENSDLVTQRLSRFLTAHADALARQGTIRPVWRTRGGVRYGPYQQLVVRVQGRQRTFYLGRAAARIALARRALAELQEPRRSARARQRRARRGRALLRAVHRDLDRRLRQLGLWLKGWEARGMRSARYAGGPRGATPRAQRGGAPP